MARPKLTPYGPPIAIDLRTRERFESYIEYLKEKDGKKTVTKSYALNELMNHTGFDFKGQPL